MATPPNQDTAVASTSTGAPVNMVENPGLTDEEVASFLEFLELDDVQIVQWIESHEIEAAFNKAKLPLGKKASYRKVFNTLHRPLPHREPTPSPSNPANAFNQQTSTTTTAPSQSPVFSQSTPSAQAVLQPTVGAPAVGNNDLINVSYWCDLSADHEGERACSSTKAISSVSQLKCPDDTPYRGHADPRSINYVLSLIRYEAKQNGLGPRLTYLFLSRCLSQLVRVKLQAFLEHNIPSVHYMTDYTVMLSSSLLYLQKTYASSNTHSEVMLFLNKVTMEPNDTDIYAYLDKLESAVAMCQSVGLFLQPSQVNIHYRQGLNSTLRAIADQHYPAIDDVQLLTQSLRSHVRRNPDLFKQATTNSKPTTTTTTTKSVQPSTTGGSSTTKLPLVRVEDPTTIKLCKEQGICLAWTARKQCRHGDSCKYKHAEVVRRIACGMEDPQRAQLPTRTTTSMVLRSPLLAGTEYNIVPDTGCSLSIISWRLAGHLLSNIPNAKVIPAKSVFDTATQSQSFNSDYELQIDLPISDSKDHYTFKWQPAIVGDGLLLHSEGLLGMDALTFEPQGLCLDLGARKVQVTPFLYDINSLGEASSHPTAASTLTVTPSTTDGCNQQASPSSPTPSTTRGSPSTPTTTEELSHGTSELHDELKTNTVRPVTKSKKSKDPYDLSPLTTSTPSFSAIPQGHTHVETVYQNEWCTVGVLSDNTNQKTFYVDYSDQLLHIVLKNQPKPVSTSHYKLITATREDRQDAEQRLDDLIASNKLIPTPDSDKNNLYSNWYPVRGRKRCRPIVPALKANQLLQQAQRSFPIKDRQVKIDRLLNKFRTTKFAIGYDVKDAYRSIRLGGNAQLLSQVIYNGHNYTYVFMCDGHSTNPPVLELCVQRVIEDILNDPDFADDLTSYMDDIQQLTSLSVSDDNKGTSIITNHFANYNMILTSEPLHGPDSNGRTVLGSQLSGDGDYLHFPDDKYAKTIHFDTNNALTYGSALSLLGFITQAWDLLPWHILACKNALTALVSRVRALNEAKWKSAIQDPRLLSLLRRWQQLLRDTPPSPLYKHISVDQPLYVYFDASETLGAMVALQDGKEVLRHQWKWSRKERSLHINIKEATTAYYSLSVIVNYELDTGKKFSSICLFGDNRTANAALSSGKVSASGKQSVLLQRVVDLTYLLIGKRHIDIRYVPTASNPADSGTRSELYSDIINLRDTVDGFSINDFDVDKTETNTSTVHISRVVRKRDATADSDSSNNKRVRLEKPIKVPRRPLLPLVRPSTYDTVQLPPHLLEVYRSLPLQDDGKREVADSDFLQACATHCHEQRHAGAPEVEATLKSTFHCPTINLKDLATTASRSCTTCSLIKTAPGDRQFKNSVDDDFKLPTRVWESASLDVLGPFYTDPVTKKPKFFSINLVDQLSNVIVSLPTIGPPTSTDIQRACNLPHRLYNHAVVNITTDNATIITAADHKLPTIKFHYVPPRCSAFNGHVERRNKLMNERLRRLFATTAFVDDDTWRDFIAKSCYEINTSRQPLADGLTPLDMILETSTSPMDATEICRPSADKWDKWIGFKHLCRDRTVATMIRNTSSGGQLAVGDMVLQHSLEPHPKSSTPWQPTPRTITNIVGNRVLLDDGSWTSTDKLKRFTANLTVQDDDLCIF